jgi:hypothetical protein
MFQGFLNPCLQDSLKLDCLIPANWFQGLMKACFLKAVDQARPDPPGKRALLVHLEALPASKIAALAASVLSPVRCE